MFRYNIKFFIFCECLKTNNLYFIDNRTMNQTDFNRIKKLLDESGLLSNVKQHSKI